MTQSIQVNASGKSRYTSGRAPLLARVRAALVTPGGFVWVILAVLLIAIVLYNPQLGEPGQFLRFIARMAPVAIVAIGQYFVLVSGEFDLSMGAVIGVQVVLAGTMMSDDPARILPTLLLMFGIALVVGLVNGLVTTLLRVPGFITTLGMMLVLSGLAFYSTGGSAGQNPVDEFRVVGRGGIELPVLGYLPWAVLVLVVTVLLAAWLTRRPFGRLLLLSGANAQVARLTGTRVWWLQTRAYIISAFAATVAAILLVGYAGVHPSVGAGYEFTAITACVIAGVVLGGGRGWLLSAVAGAFVLESLFTLLNFVGIAATWRPTVQGAIILAAMIAAGPRLFTRRQFRRNRILSDSTQATPEHRDGQSAPASTD
ncbi:ABC transporter permease [Microbacterium sp. KNMS]